VCSHPAHRVGKLAHPSIGGVGKLAHPSVGGAGKLLDLRPDGVGALLQLRLDSIGGLAHPGQVSAGALCGRQCLLHLRAQLYELVSQRGERPVLPRERLALHEVDPRPELGDLFAQVVASKVDPRSQQRDLSVHAVESGVDP
jgi:hypothetical protein